jgi:hypothetical protein
MSLCLEVFAQLTLLAELLFAFSAGKGFIF